METVLEPDLGALLSELRAIGDAAPKTKER
jgi:hypothetical protein